jgi:hypothetical protein
MRNRRCEPALGIHHETRSHRQDAHRHPERPEWGISTSAKDQEIVRHLVGGQGAKVRSPVEQLSDRELEVFGLLGGAAADPPYRCENFT